MFFIVRKIIKVLLIIFALLSLSCTFVYFYMFKIPSYIKESQNLRENYIKVEATIIAYESKAMRRWINHDGGIKYSYSPVCLYVDDAGNEHLLKTDRCLYVIPEIGTVKEIYIYPDKPGKYYEDLSDMGITIVLAPVFVILSLSYSYFTIKGFMYCIKIKNY